MPAPEIWLTGPVTGIPPLLQPVAHGLLQCAREVRETLEGVSDELLWRDAPGTASAGFHVRHAIGSLDRLLTYARGEQLSAEQLYRLAAEGDRSSSIVTPGAMITGFETAVANAIERLRAIPDAQLTETREVGRGRLPSTVIGLLFHAAEHTQRHVGQLVTTMKVVRAVASDET